MTGAGELSQTGAEGLVRVLADEGHVTDPVLREAFERVSRHMFLPERIWIDDDAAEGGYALVERESSPGRWWQAAYGNEAVVTQMDDGGPDRLDPYWLTPTSSASQPGVVARMLAEISLQRDQRVLEIGTGTGFNAALLAEVTGQGNVTTIEVDPTVCAAARRALTLAGYENLTVACGDGEQGYPENAPYDRVLSTASVLAVPHAWVEQTIEGGRIITPFQTAFCTHGMVRLTVSGGQASGRFTAPLLFMTVRGQRRQAGFDALFTDQAWEESREKDLDADVSFFDDADAEFAAGLRLPGVHQGRRAEGRWLCSDDSWAYLDAAKVFQWGPRDLFDEVIAAVAWWYQVGRPELSDFGLTITKDDGQRVWLGDPDGPGWDLPGIRPRSRHAPHWNANTEWSASS
ncbi:MAG: methyltransferase domain-containing protein [Streptomycetales bacterium]